MPVKKKEAADFSALEMPMTVGKLHCHIVGKTPLIMHRFSAKARRELLLPSRKKNAAERQITLKHDPVTEFRETLYFNRDQDTPAAFHIPGGAFSKALAEAALDVPGATKSKVVRLTSIADTQINLYGVPRLYMTMVRMSDAARTPDVSSRAIFPRWACKITVNYIASLLKEGQIANLLAWAGVTIGIGDWRSQKGGVHGSFRLAGEKDEEYRDILKTEARKVQMEAIRNPVCYDAESEELLAWFNAEVARREQEVPSASVDEIELEAPAAGNGQDQEELNA